MFASDEDNEFVNSPFNDVFAFVVNGVNYARLPGTTTPVAINTVNGGNPLGTGATNPSFYRTTTGSRTPAATIPIEADGLTVVLTLEAPVNPGVPNQIKLAIADASDRNLDSWVFIKGGSFKAVENCTNGIDDDSDGKVDAADPDCVCQVGAPEVILDADLAGGAGSKTPIFDGFFSAAPATPGGGVQPAPGRPRPA